MSNTFYAPLQQHGHGVMIRGGLSGGWCECEGVLVTQTALPITLIAAALSTEARGRGQELQEKAVHHETQSCSSVHRSEVKDKNE